MTDTNVPAAPSRARKQPIATLAVTMGLAAAALTAPFVSRWENGPAGPALVAYRDVVGVWTQCSGETLNVTATSPTETPEGCAIKLDKRLAGFAQAVAVCTPAVRGRDHQWAAATSLAYNIGTAGYCRSTVARRFNAGDWRGGCDAFLMWNKAGGRVIAGLTNRRRAERALCLTGLPA